MPNPWTGKGNPYTRKEVRDRLMSTIKKGDAIIAGGAGTGISAKFIERGGPDGGDGGKGGFVLSDWYFASVVFQHALKSLHQLGIHLMQAAQFGGNLVFGHVGLVNFHALVSQVQGFGLLCHVKLLSGLNLFNISSTLSLTLART